MGKPPKGTPAIDQLVKAGVSHSVHSYEHDPKAESYGLEAAEKLGMDPARVFKTLLVSGANDTYVAIVPVGRQLDLKAMAAAVGEKHVAMTDPKTAERMTGYVVGGISPLGQRKSLTTVVDETAAAHDTINVSAGKRGLEVELAPGDLVAQLNAVLKPIART